MRMLEVRNWFGGGRLNDAPGLRGSVAPPPGGRPGASAVGQTPAGATGDAAAGSPETAQPETAWLQQRLDIEAELWGEGYLTPGGAAETLRYAVPLGLSSAATLLMLGVAAGGPALTLAMSLGVWVSAFDCDPAMVVLARRHVAREVNVLARRITLGEWSPDNPTLPAQAYHHALIHDHIRHTVPEQVLTAVAESLKPRGQLVLVETVINPATDPADPGLAAWYRLEGREPGLPAAEGIVRALRRLGFDIRVQEDLSARHMKLTVQGWKGLVRGLDAERPGRTRAAAVVNEAELWTRRTRLMHEGKLRMVRWHAIKG